MQTKPIFLNSQKGHFSAQIAPFFHSQNSDLEVTGKKVDPAFKA